MYINSLPMASSHSLFAPRISNLLHRTRVLLPQLLALSYMAFQLTQPSSLFPTVTTVTSKMGHLLLKPMAMHLLIRLLVLDKRVNNVPMILLSHGNASSRQILMRISEQPNVAVRRVLATILKRTLKRSWMLSRRNYPSVSGDGRTFMSSLLNGRVNEDVLNGLASLSRRNTNKYVDIFPICAYSNIP